MSMCVMKSGLDPTTEHLRNHLLYVSFEFSDYLHIQKSVDAVPGIQTQGRRMVGADRSIELR